MVSTASAEKFDCTLLQSCTGNHECASTNDKVEIFDRVSGQSRMVLPGGFLVDMEQFVAEGKTRRDWLINGVLNGYAGLVTVYQDGTLIVSEHSENNDGTPATSYMHGKCERVN